MQSQCCLQQDFYICFLPPALPGDDMRNVTKNPCGLSIDMGYRVKDSMFQMSITILEGSSLGQQIQLSGPCGRESAELPVCMLHASGFHLHAYRLQQPTAHR